MSVTEMGADSVEDRVYRKVLLPASEHTAWGALGPTAVTCGCVMIVALAPASADSVQEASVGS